MNQQQNGNMQDTVLVNGYVTKDIEVKEITTKDGIKLPVANFSIVYENINQEKEYRSISAYGDNVEKVADFKKGDFVHIQGTEKRYTSKTGREYVSVNMKACHVLKSKEDRTRNKQHKGKDAPELTKVANKKQEEREM